MRNLKRVLSLTLASVMLLGMMVIGTSAAGAKKIDFTDANEIEYTEAVEVMVALGIIEGIPNGSFDPNGTLTREQAAKIISHMLLGSENAEKLNTNEVIFKDVAAGRWSAGYIAYCARLGILAGTGDGNFNPTGELTGVAFGKMLLVALGYDPDIQKYTGSNWSISVAKDMIDAGIDVKGTTLSAPLTREQAAQMAFQTLEADVVYYDFNLQGYLTGVQPTSIKEQGNYKDYGDPDRDDTLQFCEQYFPNLKLYGNNDAFGRPADTWTLKGSEIGTYVDTPVATFTSEMKEEDIFKALSVSGISGGSRYVVMDEIWENGTRTATATAKDSTNAVVTKASGNFYDMTVVSYYEATTNDGNGVNETVIIAKGDTSNAAGFGNGKLVEIFETNYDNHYIMTITQYSVTQITRVATTKDGDYERTQYVATGLTGAYSYTDPDKDDKAVVHGDVAEDDYVTVAQGKDGVYHIYPTTVVAGAQTVRNTSKKTITVDGTVYTIGTDVYDEAKRDRLLADYTNIFKNSDIEMNYYLDQFGYVVMVDDVSSANYAVIDAIRYVTAASDSLDTKGYVTARLIFADGTTEQVTLNKLGTTSANAKGFVGGDSVNVNGEGDGKSQISTTISKNDSLYHGMIVSYSVSSNGKYNLTVKTTGNDSTGGKVITKGIPTVKNAAGGSLGVTGNSATVYVVKTKDNDGNSVYNSYVGYQNVPTIEMKAGKTAYVTWVTEKNIGTYIFVDATAGADVDTAKNTSVVYIFDVGNVDRSEADDEGIWTFKNAALDGKDQTDVKFKKDLAEEISVNGLYEVEMNDEDVVTKYTKIPNVNLTKWTYGDVTRTGNKDVVGVNGKDYAFTGATKAYIVDIKNEYVSETTPGSAQGAIVGSVGDAAYVKVLGTSGANAETVDIIYIIQNGGSVKVIDTSNFDDETQPTAAELATAIAAAPAGDVVLPENVVVPASFSVPAGRTLVLANSNIPADGEMAITGGKVDATAVSTAGKDITVEGSAEVALGSVAATAEVTIKNTAKVTVEGNLADKADVTVSKDSTLTVTGNNNCLVKVVAESTGTNASDVRYLFASRNSFGMRKIIPETTGGTWTNDGNTASTSWGSILLLAEKYDATDAECQNNTRMYSICKSDGTPVYQMTYPKGYLAILNTKPCNASYYYSDGSATTTGLQSGMTYTIRVDVVELNDTVTTYPTNSNGSTAWTLTGKTPVATYTFTVD